MNHLIEIKALYKNIYLQNYLSTHKSMVEVMELRPLDLREIHFLQPLNPKRINYHQLVICLLQYQLISLQSK